MAIRHNLERAVWRYLRGDGSLRELQEWRRAHAQEIADSRDRRARALYGALAVVLSEYDIGDRDEGSLRSELAGEFPEAARFGFQPPAHWEIRVVTPQPSVSPQVDSLIRVLWVTPREIDSTSSLSSSVRSDFVPQADPIIESQSAGRTVHSHPFVGAFSGAD